MWLTKSAAPMVTQLELRVGCGSSFANINSSMRQISTSNSSLWMFNDVYAVYAFSLLVTSCGIAISRRFRIEDIQHILMIFMQSPPASEHPLNQCHIEEMLEDLLTSTNPCNTGLVEVFHPTSQARGQPGHGIYISTDWSKVSKLHSKNKWMIWM